MTCTHISSQLRPFNTLIFHLATFIKEKLLKTYSSRRDILRKEISSISNQNERKSNINCLLILALMKNKFAQKNPQEISSNRPFLHYAPVSKHEEMRTRLGWTISYKSPYFVHLSFELVPLFTEMRERSTSYGRTDC